MKIRVGALCLFCWFVMAASAWAQDAEPPAERDALPQEAVPESEMTEWEEIWDRCKHPLPWLSWGGDIRVRQVAYENAKDLDAEDDSGDPKHFFETRYRVWARAGSFFGSGDPNGEDGLSLYARLAAGPRYQRGETEVSRGQTNLVASFLVDVPQDEWREIAYDNVYAEWRRIARSPISVSVGRQDLVYARGFVLYDGTPLDESRTLYNDAIKASLHLDNIKTTVDLLAVSNLASRYRLLPIGEAEDPVLEFDTALFGVYAINTSVKNHEFHVYFLSKDEDPPSDTRHRKSSPSVLDSDPLWGRVVHCLGGLAQGKAGQGWDYYGDLACQWGTDGEDRRSGLGANTDLGYTFEGVAMAPRVHLAYEFLSGDDPGSDTYNGWDPMLGRWARWSELLFWRRSREYGRAGYWTNLHRLTAGVAASPVKKMTLSADASALWAHKHEYGTNVGEFGDGLFRGTLLRVGLEYEFTKYLSSQLLVEKFTPGDYYSSGSDSAVYGHWQVLFEF